MKSLFAKYKRLVLFDTETTGLDYENDQIIEFAAVALEMRNGKASVIAEYDELIGLRPGTVIPPEIEELTGITNEAVQCGGIPKEMLCQDIAELIRGNTLLLA